jgi:1-acyl-sn-glycerol-3-phosphate acyltransferase
MRFLRGLLRLFVTFVALALVGVLIPPLALVPVRVRGARLAAWICTLTARFAMRLFNVRFACPAPEKFWQHRGLVFPNHLSYFDILMLFHILPMRFVSKAEVRAWPFVGWAAVAVGTVFVKREKKESRTQVRQDLARAGRYPPIVLFPEGGTGEANGLRPFRYGAFEIAVEHRIPYLLCAIVYERPEIMIWRNESIVHALWRLACAAGPIHAQLVPLALVDPQPGDDPRQLAVQAHQRVAEALKVPTQM